jgi:hypothetical protein
MIRSKNKTVLSHRTYLHVFCTSEPSPLNAHNKIISPFISTYNIDNCKAEKASICISPDIFNKTTYEHISLNILTVKG